MVNAKFTVEDGVGRVEIRRPEALNALDSPTKYAIIDRLREFADADDVRAVLFESAGDAFCAGGDVTEIPETDYSLREFTDSWAKMFDAMTGMGKPTVARVDGYALGGGFDLVLHADIAVASSAATLGQPEVGLGIVNHFSPPLLRESVGEKRTLDLMLTGRTVSGAEAADMGLVARSVPAADLDAEVEAVLDSLRAKSPRVLRKLKEGLYATRNMDPDAARAHLEAVALESARVDPDYREGIDAQLEGREPNWE